jgi:hypothetical protein
MEHEHIYRAKLDFLYQSIAVYAATIVIYLLVRGLFAIGMFPTFWQDPLLLMLCAITLISVLALIYNLLLHRQIEVTADEIRFMSRARKRAIGKNDVRYMQFGRERGPIARKGVRIVKIALKERRRPVRIRLGNFEHGRHLLHDLKEWAGPLATTRRQIRAKRIDGGPTSLGEHTA